MRAAPKGPTPWALPQWLPVPAFAREELFQRCYGTLLLFAFLRIGAYVPIPGVHSWANVAAVGGFAASALSSSPDTGLES